jgi:hypothetical protein
MKGGIAMAKVRTLSQKFMKGHPRAGEQTHFVEQVLNALGYQFPVNGCQYQNMLLDLNKDKIKSGKLSVWQIMKFVSSLDIRITGQKLHTIRNGNRFKTGEKVQLAVWSGKPYVSPQIKICPEMEVLCYNFEVEKNNVPTGPEWINSINNEEISENTLKIVADNDGLSLQDFKNWFKYPSEFDGQIIAWVDPMY